MERPPARLRSPLLPTLGLLAAALCLGACGSSPRSDFYRARSLDFRPVAGTYEPLGEELASEITTEAAWYTDTAHAFSR